ncbi:MAG: hypothetical protein LCI02_14400 [Proteobacteria bacterium]|nr:hypothetical protein [Pseudomonadota bacterium]
MSEQRCKKLNPQASIATHGQTQKLALPRVPMGSAAPSADRLHAAACSADGAKSVGANATATALVEGQSE